MAEEKRLNPRLSIHGLRQFYDTSPVLTGVDLVLRRGETVAIIGRSGCGKSTLLRCISLLENPVAGDADLDGQAYMRGGIPQVALAGLRSQITMVFQEYNLFPNMTALRNITLALERTKGMKGSQAKNVALELAGALGIEQVLNRYPHTLSGGQAQRLALARTMVLQPKVLLLDEITAALDPDTLLDVIAAIRAVRAADQSGDMAVLVVTHLMRFAADFADRICFLHQGQIWEDLPSSTFFRDCQRPETREFVATMTKIG